MDTDFCVGCSNVFNARSKPRWAFGQDGRLLGKAHTSCIWYQGTERMLTWAGTYEVEIAYFNVWLTDFCERPERDTPAWDAWNLVDRPSEVLTDRVGEILQYHLTSGKWTIGRIFNFVAAHGALIREFQAWRAGRAA